MSSLRGRHDAQAKTIERLEDALGKIEGEIMSVGINVPGLVADGGYPQAVVNAAGLTLGAPVITPAGPYNVGDTVQVSVVATNTGGVDIDNLTMSTDHEVALPDPRYVDHVIQNLASDGFTLRFNLSAGMPARLCYFPTSDTTAILYTNCATSYAGSLHVQSPSGLASGVEYGVVIQSSTSASSTCAAMIWDDLTAPIIVTTL